MDEERFDYEVDDATRFVDNLKDRVHDLYDKNEELKEENERLNNIINKALEKSKGLQYKFGYVLEDLIYLLMQGSDKE